MSPHLPRGAATIGEVEEERVHGELESAWLLAEASEVGARSGVLVETEVRLGHPARQIVQAAQEHQVDLIVVGHSGHSGVQPLPVVRKVVGAPGADQPLRLDLD